MTKVATNALIARFFAIHNGAGRPENCSLAVMARAGADRPDTEAFYAEWFQHPDWRPHYSVEAISTSVDLQGTERALMQEAACQHLAEKGTNIQIQKVFNDYGPVLTDLAVRYLIEGLRRVHPNAKAFVQQSRIAAHIPSGFDLTDLPCRDDAVVINDEGSLVQLADLPLSGDKV